MTTPKYKIGDCVIAKGWEYYNLFIVCSAWWNDEEWGYELGRIERRWFSVHHWRKESEIIETINAPKE